MSIRARTDSIFIGEEVDIMTRARDDSITYNPIDHSDENQSKVKLKYIHPNTNQIVYYYHNPLKSAAIYILIQEMCERLAFYGITPNLQGFLKEFLGISSADADSYIAIFSGLIYATPLISASISDSWLGLYLTILVFSSLYFLGLCLLSLSAIPDISSPWMIHVSLLGLIALGTGGIKSCVNVFGAQQYHPTQHQNKITSYYTWFYAVINIGALVGGIVCPILQESVSYFASFMVPTGSFLIATIVFIIGSAKYIRLKSQGSLILTLIKILFKSIYSCQKLSVFSKSNGGDYDDSFIIDIKKFLKLLPVFILTIPFMLSYAQMTTAYLTQGKKMDNFNGNFNPALMQNFDAISVILMSIIIDTFLYPYLRSVDKMPDVLTRFCIGNLFGVLSLLSALIVELAIMSGSENNTIPLFYQIPQFFLIATGEIFLVSTSYEVAFKYSPDSLKAIASAFNLLFFSAANFIAAALFQVCKPWLLDEEFYTTSHYDYYFILLASICFIGAIASLLVRKFWYKSLV